MHIRIIGYKPSTNIELSFISILIYTAPNNIMGLPLQQLFISSLLIGYFTNFSQAVVISELLVVVGGAQELNCQLNNTQSTTVGIWYKDEEVISSNTSSLPIHNAGPSDTGNYSYGLANGDHLCNFTVIVGEYVSELNSVVILMGTSRHFFCYANASIPLELVTWLKDGVEVQSTKYIVNKSVIFQLNAAAVTDSGNYSCVQGNQLLGSVYVTVGDIPPKVENLHCYSHYQGENRCEWSPIPNSENNLQTNYNCTCYEEYQGATVIGKVTNSTCNLDDRLNSATTCSLTILSYNVLGSVAVTKSLTFNYIRIPYPPTGVKFMKNKNGELLLSWNYPLGYFDYNAHMLKYKVRYKAVSNSVWEELPAEKDIEEDTQYRFSSYHMEPFVKYMAQVRARQYVNFSNWSESAYYTTDEAKPERQVDATFETYDKGNTRSITIRWKHLEKKYSNGIILAYYLILQNSSHGVLRSTSEAANETEFTFKGLQKDMSYYVNITAANSVDNSTQTMLFIKAASYSYDVVIIVVILAFSIIILFSIGFLSWNKLKKAECMQPYPEPNFLDLSTYNFNIRDDNYNTIEEHEMFDDLKCQQPPEADQENLISFSSSDPIHPLIVKQVELPPTNIFDDSGLDQSKNREKCRLKSPQRKNDSCGPYAKCSITKCSPQHCISNSMGSLDTSGFNSRDTSSGQTKRTELSPSRSMPDILCESLMENNNSSENGYMLMNNSAQHSPACMQEAHTTSDDHINDYVIRTFFPGSRNQFSDSAPKNMQPPLVTPDIGGYVDGRNINLPRPSVPSNNASKTKNVSSYVDHLQLQQHTRGASNSSPNLFTNPNINSLKGNVKSASALHVDKVDNQTTLSAASSGYIPSAMMPSFYDGPPGSSPDTAGKPMKGSHQGPGGPCTRPVSSRILTGFLVNGGTRAGQPVTHLAESRLSPKGFNPRRQQKSNGCIQTANLPLHKKSNNTTYMKPNGTSRQVPCNSTNHMAGSSSRKPPPHSLPLHHTHSPVPSRDSEQGCNRPSQPTQSSSQNHKTPHGKEVDSSSSVENGYIPLRSFSSPE